MKTVKLMLAGFVILSSVRLEAALTPFYQKNKFTTIRDGVVTSHIENRRYDFRVEILSDEEGLKYETFKKGAPFVTARPEERYAIRVHNPLPVRVAVNLTVDGLNTITGKPSGVSDGSKWIIDPYSYITIRGWQVNGGEARRFFFTEKPRTYAAWRGEKLNRDLAVNCGVIGAAYFWNKEDLQRFYDANPTYVYTAPQQPWRCGAPAPATQPLGSFKAQADSLEGAGEAREDSRQRKSLAKEKAGTGMGERESHPTQYVDFEYSAGMYKAAQAVVIYYDFAPVSNPNPFPGLSYAPEMD